MPCHCNIHMPASEEREGKTGDYMDNDNEFGKQHHLTITLLSCSHSLSKSTHLVYLH